MANSNARPLAWHRESLKNHMDSLRRQRQELERQMRTVERSAECAAFLTMQIECAEKEGKTHFDGTRYKVTRVKK